MNTHTKMNFTELTTC